VVHGGIDLVVALVVHCSTGLLDGVAAVDVAMSLVVHGQIHMEVYLELTIAEGAGLIEM